MGLGMTGMVLKIVGDFEYVQERHRKTSEKFWEKPGRVPMESERSGGGAVGIQTLIESLHI